MKYSHVFILFFFLCFFIVPVSATFEDDFNDDNIGEWTIVEGTWTTLDTDSFDDSNGYYARGYGYELADGGTTAGMYQDIGALYSYYKFDIRAKHWGPTLYYLHEYGTANYYWQYPNYGINTHQSGTPGTRHIHGIGFTMTTVTVSQDTWYRVYIATTSTQLRIRIYDEAGTEITDQTVAYTPPDPADGARMWIYGTGSHHSGTGYIYAYVDNIYGWDEMPGIGTLTVPSTVIVNEVADLTYTFTESDFTNYNYFMYVYTPSGAVTTYTITSPTPEVFEYNTAGRLEGIYTVYLTGKSVSTGEEYIMDYKEMVLNSTVEAYGYTIDATTWTNLSSTNVSYYQALTYHNTTSDANGFYTVDDLLVDYLIHINATKTNYTHDDFSVTPTFSYNNSVDLYLFPSNRSLSSTSIVEGMTVNYPWHQGVGSATVNIYNSTWSNTTISNTHGYYIFNLSTLVNGTYTVNATLSGYENSTEYNVTVTKNESTVQNIVLNKKYTLTIAARDASTSSPLSTFTTTVDGTQTLTTNGTTTHSLDYGIYLVSVGADDYISASEYTLMIMDRSIELSLSRYSDDTGGIYYQSHYVEFILTSLNGTRYPDVAVNVYVEDNVTALYTDTTGSLGSVVFEMDQNVKYRLTFIDAILGINEEIELFPIDIKYYVYIDESITFGAENVSTDLTNYTVNYTTRPWSLQNLTSAEINSTIGLGLLGQGIVASVVLWVVVGAGGLAVGFISICALAMLGIVTWIMVLFCTMTAISLYILGSKIQ